MAHDVFISYSSKDKTVADAVTAKLESLGIRCWIAPRDILPGRDWSEAIVDGIEECRLMVLIFSTHANESVQIKREVERAVNKGHPIIPYRIEDVKPTKSLEYFISSQHWLDALTPNLEDHLNYLGETVNLLLAQKDGAGAAERSRPFHQPSGGTSSRSSTGAPFTKQLTGLVALIVLVFLGWTFYPRGNPDLEPAFEGDWHQENGAGGFSMDITIDEDGLFHNSVKLGEEGTYSYTNALRVEGFGGQRLSGWQPTGPATVTAVGLIPNNIWGFISFAIPQAVQGNQIYKLATEAVFTRTAGAGVAPRKQSQQVERYEYNPNIGGIPWRMTAEFGPGNKYRFTGAFEDSGKLVAKDGRWTCASKTGNVTNGSYQVLDKNTISMTAAGGPGIWKRK